MAIEDSYLAYFTKEPLWQIWNLFLLGLARIVPIIAIAPFLGAKAISNPMKVIFGIAITAIFMPFLITKSSVPLVVDIQFILLAVKEALIGAMMGFIISIPFFYAQAAGGLIDHQRGAQSLQVTDPSTQTQSSPVGILYGNMMLIIFFYVGGPFLFFDALYTSYEVMPIDQFLPPVFFSDKNPLWLQVILIFNDMLKISLQLSAPALITILMSDLFLGIANRMAPQVQISFLLWSLKAFVGLAVLWVSWGLIVQQMDRQALEWLKYFQRVIHWH
jgi:type III secretion protein SpaR/YscT/HrcT